MHLTIYSLGLDGLDARPQRLDDTLTPHGRISTVVPASRERFWRFPTFSVDFPNTTPKPDARVPIGVGVCGGGYMW
jgi:hypothetical protein